MAAIGSAALYGLKALTEETATNAREILNAARITGMSTDALQGLNYAAKQSGVSAEELQHGLVHLARSAREATMGGGGAGLAFQQMGIRVTDGANKLRPLDSIFSDVAARLQAMPDGTNKAALAMSLFGRAGAQLIPFLDQGPAGIAAFTEEAKKLGVVMSGEQLAAANRYKITLDRMAAAVTGLKNAIALQLFPAMGRSTEQLIKWISAHRQWIALNVAKAFEKVSQVLHGVVDLFERIWKSGAAGRDILIALGVAVAAFTAPWLALIAALALVAEDIEGFFEGKRSITGLLVKAAQIIKVRWLKAWDDIWIGIQQKGFFTFLYDEFAKFFVWIGPEIDKLGDRIAKAIPRSLLKDFYGGDVDEGIHELRMQRQEETGSPDVKPAGGVYNWLGGTFISPPPQVVAASSSRGGTAFSVPISIGQLTLSGSGLTGEAPKDFAEQLARHLGNALVPEMDKFLREASAATAGASAP